MTTILPFPQPRPGECELTVAEVVQLYLDHDARLGPEARASREHKLKIFVAALGGKKVSQCRPSDLEHWLAERVDIWPAASTRKAACSGVQRAFNWAVRDRRIPENPFRGVSVDEEEETGRAMTDREFAAVLRSTTPIFRRVLVFLGLTGCRPGELARLEWTMIDVDAGIAILQKHKTRKKTKKPRIIYLNQPALALLAWILADQERSGHRAVYCFLNARGGKWTKESISLRWQRLREKAGIPEDCVPYGLRHRFGTRAAMNGVPIKTVSELLGHSSTATTERYYLHVADEHAHMAAAAAQAIRR